MSRQEIVYTRLSKPKYVVDKYGNVGAITWMKSKYFGHHERVYRRLAALDHALSKNNLSLAKSLINAGGVNSKNKNGDTALHLSAKRSNLTITEYLLNHHKASVNVINHEGDTPLRYAVISQNLEIIKILIAHGADINCINGYEIKSTALHQACVGLNCKIIEWLLENGANVKATDARERTPITNFLYIGANDWEEKNRILNLLLEHCEIDKNPVEAHELIFGKNQDWDISKTLLERIAEMQALNISLNPQIINSISKCKKFYNYLLKCTKELEKAKNTLAHNCNVTFFDLMMDDESELVNYAKDKNLMASLKNFDFDDEFPIFGKGIEYGLYKLKKINS